MTPEKIEKDRAPERIWSSLDSFGFRESVSPYNQTSAKSTEYVRVDLFDALTAERDHWKAIYEAERDDELLNIARQSGWQDGIEERRKLEAEVARLTQERDDALSLTAAAYEAAAQVAADWGDGFAQKKQSLRRCGNPRGSHNQANAARRRPRRTGRP